jgi:uncharacterized protein YifE (UPF0438 family)
MNNRVANGLGKAVTILLKRGGLMESFNAAISTSTETLFVAAFRTYRAPVELFKEKQWKKRRQETEDKERVLELAVDESDICWIEIQIQDEG